ncbi:MAG: hypothetical protein IJM87_10705 [Ruminococcus sp.]|nr:hypothetical protein [Ruminococcus sp.]
MTADIGQELYEKIKAEFEGRVSANGYIKAVTKRIAEGTATMNDVSLYAKALGSEVRLAIAYNISAEVLPEGQMFYNIAQKILDPLLHDNHSMVNDIAAEVQKKLDDRHGIRIKPQKAPFPEDRLGSVLSAASEQGLDEATMKRRMSAPAETMTQSFADDYMKENAKFRTRAGFKEYIVRKEDGKCCEWCSKLAGRYLYPESTPHDVFRRHDNCGCSVTYEDGEMRQDAWSKRTWQASPEELAERRELEEKLKPVRFSPEEAAAKEREVLEQRAERLTNVGESGIIDIENRLHNIGFNTIDPSFFKNVNTDMQKSITEQLTYLENKFRAISNSNKPSLSADLKGGATACVRSELNNPQNQKLMLSSRDFKNRKKHISNRRKDVESFYCMPCNVDDETLSRYVVTHEYGHMLENMIAARDMKGTINTFPRLIERYQEQIEKIARTIDPDYDKNKSLYLSKYVREEAPYGHKHNEFFAECFANSQLGQPNVLGQAILQWLEKRGFDVL